jgi:hypothetical protein
LPSLDSNFFTSNYHHSKQKIKCNESRQRQVENTAKKLMVVTTATAAARHITITFTTSFDTT